MINIQTYTRSIYNDYIDNNADQIMNIINKWFENLYEIRQMLTYKKTTKVKTGGRSWWT